MLSELFMEAIVVSIPPGLLALCGLLWRLERRLARVEFVLEHYELNDAGDAGAL